MHRRSKINWSAVTVNQAAGVLGITPEARQVRIRHRTIAEEREAGQVYVVLDVDQLRLTADQPTDRTDLLVAELQDRVRSLEEANRENRRIIAALTARITAIEAPPSEPPESPTAATEQPGRVEPQGQAAGAQEGTERRSWWRRMFGFE
jgi:hypothetical protein